MGCARLPDRVGALHARCCPLLGRLTAVVHGPVRADRTYLVVGQPSGSERRKRYARAGMYDEDLRPVATSHATWISLT